MKGNVKPNFVKGGANFSDSTSLHKITVPTGVVWQIQAANVYRDTSALLNVILYDASDNQILLLLNDAAATGQTAFPATEVSENEYAMPYPVSAKAGWYISFAFGAGQGANAFLSLNVVEEPL